MLKKTGIIVRSFVNSWTLLSLALLILSSCRSLPEPLDSPKTMDKSGKLIILVGISGSGKSTLARELAAITNAKLYLEPEEKEWPELVKRSNFYGEFAAMTSLRNLRVKNLYDAKHSRDEGYVAIVDSYYDKITSYYIDKPGMEWLISPKDPYFEAARIVTDTDTKYLPNADCMIFLDIDIETWQQFLKLRNRDRDNISGFRESFYLYKKYIEDAVIKLSKEQGVKLIKFSPNSDDVKIQAYRIKNDLLKQQVLSL